MKDKYDDEDLQRLYDEEYFSTRSRPPMSIRRAEFIVEKFQFSKLSNGEEIQVPVDGDKFFNKHIAIVGSTGSGKSNTIATIIQKATSGKASKYGGLNNSHIIIFDMLQKFEMSITMTYDQLRAHSFGVDTIVKPTRPKG